MTKNINNLGRIFRFILGIILIIFAVANRSVIMGLIGLFVIYESLAGWCLFYWLLGKNSCKIERIDKNDEDKKI